jgi:single-strand DNA-binding protein
MAARSLNKVQLIGNLTRDPELRYTPQGTAVCTFGLATNRQWTTETGEKREEAEFHRIVAWNKLAELCSQLLFKGRRVFVEGRLQTRQWTAQDGTPRQTTEIVIADMIILDSKRAPGEIEESVVEEPGVTKESLPEEGEASEKLAKSGKIGAVKEKKTSPGKGASKAAAKADDKKSAKATSDAANGDQVKADDIPF